MRVRVAVDAGVREYPFLHLPNEPGFGGPPSRWPFAVDSLSAEA